MKTTVIGDEEWVGRQAYGLDAGETTLLESSRRRMAIRRGIPARQMKR